MQRPTRLQLGKKDWMCAQVSQEKVQVQVQVSQEKVQIQVSQEKLKGRKV